jgi:Fe-S cluster assembly protein SufD
MHTNVVICHHEPHATSMQLFKGVLTDQSKSSFQGKIYVAQKAQKTQAYQLNNNLVLSRSAEAHSKPNLEIFADDVKASHGATVGKLDPEQLFYLKTRGFSEQQAQNTLISGFLQEVVACIPMQNEKKVLECEIIDFLKT